MAKIEVCHRRVCLDKEHDMKKLMKENEYLISENNKMFRELIDLNSKKPLLWHLKRWYNGSQ